MWRMWMFRHPSGRAVILMLVLGHAASARAGAQLVTVAAGAAIPRSHMSERRALGEQISLGIAPSYRTSGRTVRAELTQSWFRPRGSYARSEFGRLEGTLSITSALGYLIFTAGPDAVSPHVGFGLGVCRMNIPGNPNPYGTIPQVGWLVGATIGEGRVRGLIEVHDQLILSDYGNDEFEGSRFIPVRLGVSMKVR